MRCVCVCACACACVRVCAWHTLYTIICNTCNELLFITYTGSWFTRWTNTSKRKAVQQQTGPLFTILFSLQQTNITKPHGRSSYGRVCVCVCVCVLLTCNCSAWVAYEYQPSADVWLGFSTSLTAGGPIKAVYSHVGWVGLHEYLLIDVANLWLTNILTLFSNYAKCFYYLMM